MALSKEFRTLALAMIAGADRVVKNAKELYAEATMMGNSGSWARGVLLHQISLEECAKVEMLGAAVTSLLLGTGVDTKRLYGAMRRHDAKNKTNAYFLPRGADEKAAFDAGDLATALEIFKEKQQEFHAVSNDDKNAALYVDPEDAFASPIDRFSEEDFVRVRTFNDDLLAGADHKVDMLLRWGQDLDLAEQSMKEMLAATGLDSLNPKDPDSVKKLEQALQGMADRAAGRVPGAN